MPRVTAVPKRLRPAEGYDRILVFDDVGLLQKLTPEQAQAALERGELEPHEEIQGRARLIPQPIKKLTEEEKYKLRKEQERLKR